MNDHRDRQKTTADDTQVSALYRRTRNETSSAALDESIKNAARRVARRRRYRWLLPLSSAAVLLLGLSLTLKVLKLERPIEEAALSEMDDAEAKREPASMPDLAEPAVPAPSSAPYALRERPARDTKDAVPVRKRMAPVQEHEREERPALILDQAVSTGSTASSRAPAGGSKAGTPDADFPDALKHDPSRWLRHIRDLISQGRTADATAQLGQFRAEYPNYGLPDDLARLLDP